ncbi:MAG: Crp/Fnr family transcriptional regulator [Rhodocyclaceae bacterium]|nr:Crp/Fnr family transcriptional regulator [Rhodocyclaceae bacterium]
MNAALASLYPALAVLPDAARDRLLAQAREMSVPAGTVVFDEQQPCAGFPFLLSGAIRVIKRAANGRELPLYRVVPGESCIMTSSCLLGQVDYRACGIAEADTVMIFLPKTAFTALLEHPPFRDFVFNLFAERMSELMQVVEEVAFRRLDQRLAAVLLGHGAQLHTTHQQLADELGSVREIVSRLLKGFAEQGLVRLGRERIEILDAAGLRRIAT